MLPRTLYRVRSMSKQVSSSFMKTPTLRLSAEGLPKYISQSAKGAVLHVHVQPNASKTGMILRNESKDDAVERAVRIRIAAPPVDGAANKELIQYLRKITRVPASMISLIRGEESRAKDVLFKEVDATVLWETIRDELGT